MSHWGWFHPLVGQILNGLCHEPRKVNLKDSKAASRKLHYHSDIHLITRLTCMVLNTHITVHSFKAKIHDFRLPNLIKGWNKCSPLKFINPFDWDGRISVLSFLIAYRKNWRISKVKTVETDKRCLNIMQDLNHIKRGVQLISQHIFNLKSLTNVTEVTWVEVTGR